MYIYNSLIITYIHFKRIEFEVFNFSGMNNKLELGSTYIPGI